MLYKGTRIINFFIRSLIEFLRISTFSLRCQIQHTVGRGREGRKGTLFRELLTRMRIAIVGVEF